MHKALIALTILWSACTLSACADDISGFSCDLGRGEYTETVCTQAASEANCESINYEERESTFCAGTVPGFQHCCVYEGCESDLALPTPSPMSCTP